MKKIKDRIILGMVTSALGGIPGRLINAWEYNRGYTDMKYGHIASTLFLPQKKIKTRDARVIGALTNQINTGVVAIAITYLLSATGRDKAIIKGMGLVATSWLGIYALSSRMGLTRKSRKPFAHLLSFKDHLIFGGLCGYLAATLGDDALFPDTRQTEQQEKIPIIADLSPSKTEKRQDVRYAKKRKAMIMPQHENQYIH